MYTVIGEHTYAPGELIEAIEYMKNDIAYLESKLSTYKANPFVYEKVQENINCSKEYLNELENAYRMTTLPVRKCQIVCIAHPEWGTFGIYEDEGDWYNIHGDHGDRVLFKSEAVKFWTLAD